MSLLERLKAWARVLKRDVLALWIAARDRRTPWMAKVLAGAVAAYALSPIDLIPDFIPIVGYLDDVILLPAGIWLVVRMIPAPLMAEFREQAMRHERPVSRAGLVAILILWFCAATAVGALAWTRLSR
ncbi:uncharacterized membrane protein YkvA (DUF1232 family) [Caulobacter ginsengisoli]|uniref:Uncharacterized membrane protein YkvA (DUF1232 family) n=1 Tax=Caulobacter ginsengisoli TaxID=400775 RepID=A0ABU0IQI6_9CAUL|nr:YkvA family protein [Caulobacter ginsengisoli]MDQ0464273.1 uncharacterized membrane protein YkvA (DUF1232 family) [Caulobacter ginsengisoli]